MGHNSSNNKNPLPTMGEDVTGTIFNSNVDEYTKMAENTPSLSNKGSTEFENYQNAENKEEYVKDLANRRLVDLKEDIEKFRRELTDFNMNQPVTDDVSYLDVVNSYGNAVGEFYDQIVKEMENRHLPLFNE